MLYNSHTDMHTPKCVENASTILCQRNVSFKKQDGNNTKNLTYIQKLLVYSNYHSIHHSKLKGQKNLDSRINFEPKMKYQ